MKINNFRGELTDNSAKKEALLVVLASVAVLAEIPLRSAQKTFIFIIKKWSVGSKYPKIKYLHFEKNLTGPCRAACKRRCNEPRHYEPSMWRTAVELLLPPGPVRRTCGKTNLRYIECFLHFQSVCIVAPIIIQTTNHQPPRFLRLLPRSVRRKWHKNEMDGSEIGRASCRERVLLMV